nr:leucine efflux protein LeuE [Ostreibacterium oceani]
MMIENFGVINYTTYLLGVIMIVLLPGPNSLYVLALSAQQGVRNGWAAACGIFVGDAILMLLTALGAVAILTAYPALFMTIKIIGAIYLGYIGLRLVRDAWINWRRHESMSEAAMQPIKKTSPRNAFAKALLISLLNPKAILFFFSFFVQFVDPSYPSRLLPFLVLAVTVQFFSALYLGVLIYSGAKLADAFRRRKKISSVSSAGVGAGFMAFAVKLALASAGQ